jgi:hypothetical protein
MNLHDWSRVEDGTFHHFHGAWIFRLADALNDGILPPGYFALAEQHLGRKVADVMLPHASDPEKTPRLPPPPGDKAVALAEAPPRVSRTRVLEPGSSRRQRTLTIRDSVGDRIVALVEIVSRSNKASAQAVGEFVGKIAGALRTGIHAVVIDVFPPGPHDPRGMPQAVAEEFADEDEQRPQDKPLTFASYAARSVPVAFLQHLAVGDPVPNVPLFVTPDHYVELPLAATYAAVIRAIPQPRREVIERTLSLPPAAP